MITKKTWDALKVGFGGVFSLDGDEDDQGMFIERINDIMYNHRGSKTEFFNCLNEDTWEDDEVEMYFREVLDDELATMFFEVIIDEGCLTQTDYISMLFEMEPSMRKKFINKTEEFEQQKKLLLRGLQATKEALTKLIKMSDESIEKKSIKTKI